MMKLAKILLCSFGFAAADLFLKEEEEKCTIYEQDDLTNDDRVTYCSSLTACHDKSNNKFSDGFCSSPDERCSEWSVTDRRTKLMTYYDGCILK